MVEEIHPSSSSSPPLTHTLRKPGGWKVMPYIIGNETCEKLASLSLVANITVYLSTKYNLNGIFLVNIVNIWSGTSNFAPLAGGFISDAYLGRFQTLLYGSFSTFLGMALLTLTAAIHELRPPSCNVPSPCPQPHSWQLAVLFAALALLSIGAGGIRPCNISFGADQFDATTAKGREQLRGFFNWYYFSFTLALMVSLTCVVYIQSNISWVLGLAIPTAFIAISVFIFLLGRHIYIYAMPQGSIFTDVAKVIVAACRKRRSFPTPEMKDTLYNPPSNGSPMAKLFHTNRFTFLDKAAYILDQDELNSEGLPKNGWRLCSVQQVEELKCILGVMPVWVSGVICFIVIEQNGTYGVLQAMQSNTQITHNVKAPPGSIWVTPKITLTIWILIYERILIPLAKKMANKDIRMVPLQRIPIGIVMSVLSMFVAGVIESKRRRMALKHGSFVSPMSFAWILPQLVFSGMIEAFASISIIQYLTEQLPSSMRTVAAALFFLTIAIAGYLSTLIVDLVHRFTRLGGRSSWLGGGDLNKNRLDYYYYIIGALGVANFIYFMVFACRFVPTSNADGGNAETIDNEKKDVVLR